MLQGRQSAGWVVAISAGIFSVGCFSNKNKDVAETGAAPPPAAYPTGSSDYSGTTGGASAAAAPAATASTASNASYGATAAASAPEPFSLREGEQLVSHAIVSGDSLSSIAGKYNSSISRIQAANGMTNTKIIAGKTLQVPTSAPPSNLAMNTGPASLAPAGGAAGFTAPGYTAPSAPASGAYPSAVAPPTIPTAPSPYPPGGIAAPPLPTTPGIAGSAPIQIPGNPAATSYPREGAIPAPPQPGGAYPVPSFEGSRIQFGQ
jgi:LysM repeat protein